MSNITRRDFVTGLFNDSTESKEEEVPISQIVAEKAERELGIKFNGNFDAGYWNHVITPPLLETLQREGVTCVCGEINIPLATPNFESDGDNLDSGSFREAYEFLKIRHRSLGYGAHPAEIEFHEQAVRQLLENGISIGCTDMGPSQYYTEGLPKISNQVLQKALLVLTLGAGAAELARSREISRREFLKLAGIALAGLGVYGIILTSPMPNIFRTHNKRIHWADKMADDQVKRELEAEKEGTIDTYFTTEAEYVIRLRNAVMALNTWCLIDRYSLEDGEFNESLYLYAGMSHGGINDILAEGPYFAQDLVQKYSEEFFGEDLEKLYNAFLTAHMKAYRSNSGHTKDSDEILDLSREDTIDVITEAVVNISRMFTDPYILGKNIPNPDIILSRTRVASAKQLYLEALERKIMELEQSISQDPQLIYTALYESLREAKRILDQAREREHDEYIIRQYEIGNYMESTVYNATPYDQFVKLHFGGDVRTVINEGTEHEPNMTVIVGKLKLGGIETFVHRQIVHIEDGTSIAVDYIVDIDGKRVILGQFGLNMIAEVVTEEDSEALMRDIRTNGFSREFIITIKQYVDPGGNLVKTETTLFQNTPPNLYLDISPASIVLEPYVPNDRFLPPYHVYIEKVPFEPTGE